MTRLCKLPRNGLTLDPGLRRAKLIPIRPYWRNCDQLTEAHARTTDMWQKSVFGTTWYFGVTGRRYEAYLVLKSEFYHPGRRKRRRTHFFVHSLAVARNLALSAFRTYRRRQVRVRSFGSAKRFLPPPRRHQRDRQGWGSRVCFVSLIILF